MSRKKNLPPLSLVIITLGCLGGLKLYYTFAGVDSLGWVLGPLSRVVSFFSGHPFSYVQGEGFLFPGSGVVINKSCAGINYLIILIALSSGIIPFDRYKIPLGPWLLNLFQCYLFGLMVNSFRITASIFVSRGISGTALAPFKKELHLLTGVLFFFSALILYYRILHKQYSLPENNNARIEK